MPVLILGLGSALIINTAEIISQSKRIWFSGRTRQLVNSNTLMRLAATSFGRLNRSHSFALGLEGAL